MPRKNNRKLTKAKFEACFGCGALVPKKNGPTHQYIGASPGCWEIFGEVLAKEYEEYDYPPVHRLTVDAYAAQHPGTPSKKSIQSVAIHVIGLTTKLTKLRKSAVKLQKHLKTIIGLSQPHHWVA